MPTSNYPIADPAIAAVLAAFLAEQKSRLSAKSYRKYASTVELFTHSLNSYAWSSLDDEQARILQHYSPLKGTQPRVFCEIFGPELIPENVGEFLGYFMPRKVMCGRELEQAAGTMIRKLARWLHNNGYIDQETLEEMIEDSRDR
jgi:hypothetical protein